MNTIGCTPVFTLLLAASVLAGAQDRPPLKDVFNDAFAMGTAVNEAIVSGKDAASRAIVLRHFRSITVENAMKAAPLNPRPGVWTFGPADAFVEFGEAHGMFIVGHTLVWHNQTPAWFFQDERGEANRRRRRSSACGATSRRWLGGTRAGSTPGMW